MEKIGPSHVAKVLDSFRGSYAGQLARGFRLGEWLVQPGLCTLTDGLRTKQLEPKVMGVLLCLAQYAPQVVTREQFIRDVWDGRTVTDEVLSRSISVLRTHLGDDAHEPRFVRTIPRVGYALVVNPAALLGADLAAVMDAPVRIAVLQFADHGHEPDQDYFAEGLADELITDLSRAKGLHVIARTSARRFKEGDRDVREIGRLLGATHLVSGKVQRDGARLRIGVRLVDGGSGEDLWSGTFDRPLTDIVAVHMEISEAVVRSLARRLPPAQAGDSRPPTWNLEAYQCYLRGLQQLKRRGAAAIGSSIQMFSEAIALDPKLAKAQVSLAYAYTLLPSYAAVDASLMYSNADAALTAAAADDGDAATSAAGVKAVLEARRNHWIPAEQAFQASLLENPGNSEIRQWYSQLLGAVGKLVQALEQAQQALANDPLSPILNFRLAVAYLWNDRDSDADHQFAVARELGLEPSVTPEAFTMLLVRQRRFDDLRRAFAEIQQSRRQSDEWVMPVVAAIRNGGPDPETEALIERAFTTGQMGWVMYVGTLVLAGCGERALQSLLSRPVANLSDLEFLFVREASATRRSAGFARLVTTLRMDEYWDHFGWPPGCTRTGGSIQFQ